MKRPALHYQLYERAVQEPEAHAQWFKSVYRAINRREAYSLREDFSGTFMISSEWVRASDRHTALALDLDSCPLAYGRARNKKLLTAQQKKRLKVKRQNVISVTTPKADVIAACNFSFFIFKDHETLTKYFRAALRSLKPGGIFVLEMAGGPGMIETVKESKRFTRGGKHWFTYTWEQRSFDPVTHDAHYAIHFKLANGRKIQNAFEYDWRLWSVPEVRRALKDAGFKQSRVFWEETDQNGDGSDVYTECTTGDNAHSWISYVVGCRD